MHTFERELMNTVFTVRISGVEQNYARSAALDCFADTEALENILSLYRYGSDISCINASEVGEITPLTDIATECLSLAFSAAEISRGAIDVCMGEYFLKNKNDKTFAVPETPRRGKFEFDPQRFLIKKLSAGRIDLGAIGKGFAVDCAVKKLREVWEIENAFLTFGGSSIYAFGKDGEGKTWEINLSDDVKIPVDDFAVGASGTSVLGAHIVDARTGETPKEQPFRTWAFCGNAAIADAMSTAFMLLKKDEIAQICAKENISAAIQQTADSGIEFID